MKTITIGRHPDNNIVVNDPIIGRRHAQITQHNDGHFTIMDLNSKNGTFVNGIRIYGENRLNTTDVVQVGRTTVQWRNYFHASTGPARKKLIFKLLPILLMIIGGAVLTIFLLNSVQANKSNVNKGAIERRQPTTHSATAAGSSSKYMFISIQDIAEDLVGQTLSAPSEDGYFPKDWRWKLENGEVLDVQELNRRNDSSGDEVITIIAHLHRGAVKIDAEMILKYSKKGNGRKPISCRVSKITIPRQTDYSQYVELKMDYDFMPSLMLYNRSNMTLFVGGDYYSGNEKELFSAVVEAHSSEMIAIGSAQSYHVHFAYEK